MTHKFVIELTDDCKGYEQDVDYLERIYGAEPIKEHDEEIYNKAIDDFADKLLSQPMVDKSVIRRVKEQLKEGVKEWRLMKQ